MKLPGISRPRDRKRWARRFVPAVAAAVLAGSGLGPASPAEAADTHNLMLTNVPSLANFRDRSNLVTSRVLNVRAVNVLTSDGHAGCFAVTPGQDRSTGWQVGVGVKVQAYLHAVADCSDGASFDSPITTVVPEHVTTVNFWFSLR